MLETTEKKTDIEFLQSSSKMVQGVVDLRLVEVSEKDEKPTILSLDFIEIIHNPSQCAMMHHVGQLTFIPNKITITLIKLYPFLFPLRLGCYPHVPSSIYVLDFSPR